MLSFDVWENVLKTVALPDRQRIYREEIIKDVTKQISDNACSNDNEPGRQFPEHQGNESPHGQPKVLRFTNPLSSFNFFLQLAYLFEHD